MSVQNVSNQALFDALMSAKLSKPISSSSKYSMGIVNTPDNGKRLTFSKSIADELGITDTAFAMPAEGERKLVVGKTLPFPEAVKLTLKGTTKKTCYNAHMVASLTDMFNIDFSTKTSRSFTEVTFDMYNGVKVAIITFSQTIEQ